MKMGQRQRKADPVALATAGVLVAACAALLTSDRSLHHARLAQSTTAGAPLSDDAILTAFARIALEREHEEDRDPGSARWTSPVRVRLVTHGPADAEAERLLDAQLADLSELTGLPIRRVPYWAPANYRIVFTTRGRFAAQVRASLKVAAEPAAGRLVAANCVGLFEQDVTTQAIVRATVIIPLDHARNVGLLRRCIVEETTQVMGLPNDSRLAAPSIFDDTRDETALTALDRTLIRLLYQTELRPGLKRTAALEAARRVLPRLRAASKTRH